MSQTAPRTLSHLDTLAWIRSGAEVYVEQGRPKPGLDPAREAALLAEALV